MIRAYLNEAVGEICEVEYKTNATKNGVATVHFINCVVGTLVEFKNDRLYIEVKDKLICVNFEDLIGIWKLEDKMEYLSEHLREGSYVDINTKEFPPKYLRKIKKMLGKNIGTKIINKHTIRIFRLGYNKGCDINE